MAGISGLFSARCGTGHVSAGSRNAKTREDGLDGSKGRKSGSDSTQLCIPSMYVSTPFMADARLVLRKSP